jgi:hypothetical protein
MRTSAFWMSTAHMYRLTIARNLYWQCSTISGLTSHSKTPWTITDPIQPTSCYPPDLLGKSSEKPQDETLNLHLPLAPPPLSLPRVTTPPTRPSSSPHLHPTFQRPTSRRSHMLPKLHIRPPLPQSAQSRHPAHPGAHPVRALAVPCRVEAAG